MKFSAPGKCILAGEHSVVRGFPALATPLPARRLELRWEKLDRNEGPVFQIQPSPFSGALEMAIQRAIKKVPPPAGHWKVSVSSQIPPQAGLGSSAALSVAISRFFLDSNVDLFPFALELENIFHGNSSGLDVAAVLSPGPILFQKGKPIRSVKPLWTPHLHLADSGLRSSTKACVEKVAATNDDALDREMGLSVEQMFNALMETEGLSNFQKAMTRASLCFASWNLIPPQVQNQMDEWMKKGALAVKPTGSGDGGFLLTLWAEPPVSKELLPVFPLSPP